MRGDLARTVFLSRCNNAEILIGVMRDRVCVCVFVCARARNKRQCLIAKVFLK